MTLIRISIIRIRPGRTDRNLRDGCILRVLGGGLVHLPTSRTRHEVKRGNGKRLQSRLRQPRELQHQQLRFSRLDLNIERLCMYVLTLGCFNQRPVSSQSRIQVLNGLSTTPKQFEARYLASPLEVPVITHSSRGKRQELDKYSVQSTSTVVTHGVINITALFFGTRPSMTRIIHCVSITPTN